MTSSLCSFKEACQIAVLDYAVVRSMRSRSPELFESEYFGGGDGRSAQIDRPGVIFLAIFARLLAFGLAHRDAAEAAWIFTDFGDAIAGPADEIDAMEPPRGPCELYPDGRTMLVVHPIRPDEISLGVPLSSGKLAAQLINWRAGRLGEVLRACGTISPLLIDLNRLSAGVDDKLAALEASKTPDRRKAEAAERATRRKAQIAALMRGTPSGA